MASSIPNDPSLALGNIVPQSKLDILLQMGLENTKVDTALDALNSQIELKRSLDMTIQDLINMGLDVTDAVNSSSDVGKAITDAASNYAAVRMETMPKLIELKSQISQISESIETPVDWNKTLIKQMPISYDSMHMNAQYFSYEESGQDSDNSMAAIKSFVSGSFKRLGTTVESQATSAVQEQISSQREHHDIEGTLIITASCTHKNSGILAPFILDVDKAIRVWNFSMPEDQKMKVDDPGSLAKIAKEEGTADEASMNILSTVNYGSSFVGMVHVLRTSGTESSQKMITVAESMQSSLEVGAWFANFKGGAGVDSSFSSDVKNALSEANVTSHVSLVTVGSIPNIKSNTIETVVKGFTDFDPASMMSKLAVLQTANAGQKDTVEKAASDARMFGQMSSMESIKMESAVSSVGELDRQSNQVLDTNSLMTAFEDYVDKALAGNIGVPISYGIKPITRAQLAQMWVNKYYHGRFLGIQGDDSTDGNTAASGAGDGKRS